MLRLEIKISEYPQADGSEYKVQEVRNEDFIQMRSRDPELKGIPVYFTVFESKGPTFRIEVWPQEAEE